MRIWLTYILWSSGGMWGSFMGSSQPSNPVALFHPVSEQHHTVIVNHEELKISFQANLYAAHGLAVEKQQVAASVAFWNHQTGKFVYRVKLADMVLDYEVEFLLKEIEGIFDENGFYLPIEEQDARHLIPIALVAQSELDRMKSHVDAYQVVGYAPPNHIYISHDFGHRTKIGMHEVGHQLGAGHTYWDIMNHTLDEAVPKVSKSTMESLLAGIGIGKPHAHQHASSSSATDRSTYYEIGTPPPGFYTEGRVKKKR